MERKAGIACEVCPSGDFYVGYDLRTEERLTGWYSRKDWVEQEVNSLGYEIDPKRVAK